MNLVLSHYPLSSTYRTRLAKALGGEPEFVSIQRLRDGTLWRLLRKVRALKADLVTIAFEDDASRALLPLLTVFAGLVQARRRQVADPALSIAPTGRLQALQGLAWLFVESSAALVDVLLCARSTRRLLAVPRITARYGTGSVAYLNCNLWFGVRAGGSVGHISGVVNALLGAGYAIDFFSAGGRLMVNESAHLHPLRTLRVPAIPFEASQYRFDRLATAQIGRALRRHRPRFIYQRMSTANATGVMLSRRLGVPLVMEYNGSEVWVARHWGSRLRFEGMALEAEDACLRHAHLVVTISAVLERELIDRGVEPARIVMYPNCIDPEMFDPARFDAASLDRLREELGFSPDHVVATFIGTFGQWHGADVLARAIRALIETRAEALDRLGLRFLFVGDGLKMGLVRETLALHGADRYVRFTGLVPQKDAPGYLASSQILVSPHLPNADGSAFFGSPTKLFEYMAMGKAIVASDLDQIGEVLRPALNAASLPATAPTTRATELGVLIRPGDVAQLTEAILFAAGSPSWRATLGANARKQALARYTWKHHVEAILERLEQVIAADATEATGASHPQALATVDPDA
jgi:glycosyltransferase involved in cell wall biosynthesis